LRSTNLERAKRFYGTTLGFPIVMDQSDLFIFLAGATAIAVRGPDASTSPSDVFSPFRVGLDHVALACQDEAELARVASTLTEAGMENTGVKLDAALGKHYVAFKGSDRNAWELYIA
jgi:glyoxylase I family protein